MLIEQALIWVIFGLTAYFVYATGVEVALAQAVYNTQSKWGWLLRQYGTVPSAALAVVALGVLMWPVIWRKHPLVYQTAVAVLLTTVLGAGLISQVLVQDAANRARPRESVLAPAEYVLPAEFSGNSMPSGHAAMAFVLAAPFFVLRRRKPHVANVFLGAGIAAGLLVGGARMVLGAHFASDVLVAGALTLSAGSLFARLSRYWLPVPRWAILGAATVGVLALVLGNQFTTLLSMELPQPFRHIYLPCPIESTVTPTVKAPTLHVKLKGYGSPLSQLRLVNEGGNIKIQTHRGLYHSLSCTAQLDLPSTAE